MKKKYEVETFDHGRHYVWATNPVAAKNRIVYRLYGRGYTGWAHDYWYVREVA